MELRKSKVNISVAGGTASGSARTCKVTLPVVWLDQMGISEECRDVQLSFDGHSILISRSLSADEFAKTKTELGHRLRKLSYYDGTVLCSVVYADFTDQTLAVENHVSDPVKTAFGNRTLPAWDDFMEFLEERCISRHRAGLESYLKEIGVAEYDPLAIVEKTEGRMAEDQQWIRIEVLS